MRYTIWENTPLKWHKFITYVTLPISIVTSVYSLAIRAGDMMKHWWMWDSTMTTLSWLDIYCALASSCLAIVAFLGCLPRRRKWYGPKCVIALYFLSAAYSVFCVIVYIYFRTPESMISYSTGMAVSCAVVGVLSLIYYKKRRALFLPTAAKSEDLCIEIEKETKAPAEPITERKEEPENSLELLMKIQEDEEKERRSDEEKAPNERTRRSVPLWAAIILGASLIASLVICITVSVNSADRISELQGENEQLGKDIEYQKSRTVELSNEFTELEKALSFWGDNAVIVIRPWKIYHTYGCVYIDEKNFTIFDIDDVISKGYTPCSVCDPPKQSPLMTDWNDVDRQAEDIGREIDERLDAMRGYGQNSER